jgi:hypothetical protein
LPSSSGEDYTNLGPASPGSVVVPHSPGQHSWSGVSEQITISASISPVEARVGIPVTFTVHMSGPDKNCCALAMVYGDGAVSEGNGCDRTATGGSTTETRTHTYNKSGPHHLLIQAIGNCDRNGVLYITLDVGAGTRTSQGPALPKVEFSSSTPAPHDPYWRTVSLWGHVVDEDGYLSKLVVTFGDGTSHTFAGDPMGCRPSLDGWPLESTADLPYDPHPYWHTYGAAGHYTVTLTAYSTGCDGTQLQTAHTSFVWAASGPEPSPSATESPTPSPSPSTTPYSSPAP